MIRIKEWTSFGVLKPEFLLDPLAERERFRKVLLGWFGKEGLAHPWRETTDPWLILVSEMMLQQTTVKAIRAGERFERFAAEFPDLESIAAAPENKLLKAWEGLGYYNRVRNLQKTAKAVLTDWEGRFPRNAAELAGLPGIGPYTAGAIASFAFNEPAPIVDGNVARLFSRIFDDQTFIDSTEGKRQLWSWAGELLDQQNARVYNSALMEVGQVFCRPAKPNCLACPLASFCRTREPEKRPRKKGRPKPLEVIEHAIWVRDHQRVLLAREEGSRRQGFYRLPLRSADEVADLEILQTSQYTITKHRVTLNLYASAAEGNGDLRAGEIWVTLSELAELPIQTPVRKLLDKIL